MTRAAPVFKENSVLGGRRQDEYPSRGPAKRPAEPPIRGWQDGSVRSRRAREASGRYTGKGEMEGWGGAVDVMWAEGCYRRKGSPLENKGFMSNV